MNLLREYIRELLTESAIDPKIMKMIEKATQLGLLVIVKTGSVSIESPGGNLYAEVNWDSYPDYGPCLDGAYVTGARAPGNSEMGPLAYDVAMEVTGGLMSDRTEVSDLAANVWDYYLNNRPDVRSKQLDIMPDYDTPQLTPKKPDDDCDQIEPYGRLRDEWHTSSLSKLFHKKGFATPVMDELRRRGLLEE